jgi:3-isopropylmalate/(R)-2-methylmalate dehydratase small subunit
MRTRPIVRGYAVEPVSKVQGRVQALDRADVDTDQIIPKQFLKRIERSGFGEFLFYDWRREGLELEPGRPILVTGRNFGCGSSREHAVWALEDFGFRAIVAPSFADIFYANCTKIGILPVTLAEDDVRALMKAEEAVVDLERQVVSFEGGEEPFEINAEIRERLLKGLDDIALTLQHADDIGRFERERPETGSLTTAI